MEQAEEQAISDIVNAQTDPQGPGVAVGVMRGGEVIHRRGYGLAQLEWGQAIGPETVFGIGSVTKPFTATAVLLLEAEGRLALDDRITAYLPDYDTHGAAITLCHLLTHTSGIPNFVTQPRTPPFWEREARLEHSAAELRALFEPLPLDFAPGERYSYSNSAYCLLGMVIERVSGLLYGDFLRERVFAPLGMRQTQLLTHEAVIPQRADGYGLPAGMAPGAAPGEVSAYERAPWISQSVVYAAGAIASSLDDMMRWDAALREGKPLEAATQARMTTPVALNDGRRMGYGLGWGLTTYRGRPVVHHAGGVPGYSAFYGRFVEDDLSLIVLSNKFLYDAGALAARLANHLLALPTPAPTPITLAPEALARMVGGYRNVIREVVEITLRDGALHVSGDLNHELIPIAETVCVARDNPDLSLHFDAPGPEGYTRLRASMPFYWFEVWR